MRHGNLFVVSGPSGTGKGTLIARLLEEVPDAWLSVSATTRRPRPGEEEGVSYYFLTKEEFLSLAEEGGFLEWAEYSGNCYGTPRASVEREMAAGRQVILEIEVQGALQVREKMPEAHLVFIEPPRSRSWSGACAGAAPRPMTWWICACAPLWWNFPRKWSMIIGL